MVVKILDVPAAAAVSVCDTTQMWSRLWTLHVSVRGESGDLGVCVCVCVFRRDFSHMWWHYRETFKPRTSRKLTEFQSVGLQTVRLLFTAAQRTDLCVCTLTFTLFLFYTVAVSFFTRLSGSTSCSVTVTVCCNILFCPADLWPDAVRKHFIELQLNSLLFEGDSEVSRQQHLTSIVWQTCITLCTFII